VLSWQLRGYDRSSVVSSLNLSLTASFFSVATKVVEEQSQKHRNVIMQLWRAFCMPFKKPENLFVDASESSHLFVL
jgi:hypothetical protein